MHSPQSLPSGYVCNALTSKNRKPIAPGLLLAILFYATTLTASHATDIVYANNLGLLVSGTSWVGEVAPTDTDTMVFGPNTNPQGIMLNTATAGGMNVYGIIASNALGLSTINASRNTLGVGAGGIDLTSSGSSFTFNAGVLNLLTSQTWAVSTGRALTMNTTGTVSGTGALTIKGTGTISFANNAQNLFSGGLTIDNTNVLVGAGGNAGVAGIFGTGTVTIVGTNTIRRTSDAVTQIGWRNKFHLSGTSSTLTIGSSTVRSYTWMKGGVDVDAGVHTINLYNQAPQNVGNVGLNFSGTIAGDIAGGSSIVFNNSTGTSPIWVRLGGHVGDAGFTSNIDITVGEKITWIFDSATSKFGVATAMNVNGDLDLSNKIDAFSQTISSLTGTGVVWNNAILITDTDTLEPNIVDAVLTIDGVANTGTSIFSGFITNGTATGTNATPSGIVHVTKAGANTQVLTKQNTYTGTTTVTGGSLVIAEGGSINQTAEVIITGGKFKYDNNTTALNRNVTLNGGAFHQNSTENYTGTLTFTSGTLGGENWEGHDIAIGDNQVLAPGNSTGEMEADSSIWNVLGTYSWEINDATGTAGSSLNGWDLLTLSGDLDITATLVDKFVIEVLSLDSLQQAGLIANFDENNDYAWLIATAGAINGFDADKFFVDATGFENEIAGTWSLSVGGIGDTELYLNYTAIPEPSTWRLIAIGLFMFGVLFKRRSLA